MLTTFCLRLACGMIGSLFLLSPTEVSPRFFRTQYLVALGLVWVAATLGYPEPSKDLSRTDVPAEFITASYIISGLAIVIVPLAAVLCLLGAISCSIRGNPASWVIGVISFVALLTALAFRLKYIGSLSQSAVLLANELTSAAVLGTAFTAMLVGHSYLTAAGMSLAPLMRLLAALFVSTGLRMIFAGWQYWTWIVGPSHRWDDEAVFWLMLRWGVFAGLLVLGWMARSAAKIRSTQSATGILYVVVIFSFIGELSGQFLEN